MKVEIYSDVACPWCDIGGRRFERALAGFPGRAAVDVYETEESWTVLVALPGVPPDRIRYRLDGDSLDIVAERIIPQACAEGAIRRKEIPHGRFVRRLRFRVPPAEIANAQLENGCLLVTLRKPNS